MAKFTIEGQEKTIKRMTVDKEGSQVYVLFTDNTFTHLADVPITVEDVMPQLMTEKTLHAIERIYETQIEEGYRINQLAQPLMEQLLQVARLHVRGEIKCVK